VTTGRNHVFRRKGVPTFLHVRCTLFGRARAGVPWVLRVDNRKLTGVTDGDGWLAAALPRGAHEGELTVGVGDAAQTMRVLVGELQPPTTLAGVRARLNNLGLGGGSGDGPLDDELRRALREFQHRNQLTESGEPDEPTRRKLVERYGC